MSGNFVVYLDTIYPFNKVEDKHLESAANLIAILPEHVLRTLDALHLAIAQHHGLGRIATADNLFAKAARALGFKARLYIAENYHQK